MTGQCYYCASNKHFECLSETCTCCGERNRKHREDAMRLAMAIKRFIARKKK